MNKSRYLQIIAYVMILAIFVFVIGIARNCSRLPSIPVEGYSSGDTIDIALLYGPGGFYVYGDSLSGINKQIAGYFSLETGTPVKTWAISDAAQGMEKIEKGAFDILASVPLDNYIKKNFLVSESVFLDRLVLIQLSDSTSGQKIINSSLDLDGKKIHVAAASSALQRMKNLSEEIGGKIEIIEEPDLSDELLSLKVAAGDIDFAVVNEKVAKEIAASYPRLNYDSSISFTQFQVWLFNTNDSVIYKKFNNWFEEFRNTENYRKVISSF